MLKDYSCDGQMSLTEMKSSEKCKTCAHYLPNGGLDGYRYCEKSGCVANLLYEPKQNLNKKPVVPKWHYSLNSVWCECPSCRTQPDMLTEYVRNQSGGGCHTEYNDRCPYCGQPILWDWDEIDKKASKSKDWIEKNQE